MSFLQKIKKVFFSNKILMMLLIMIFIKKILTKSKQITQRKLNYYSELYFTVPNEKGSTTVICNDFQTPPTKILLNGEIATADYWGDIQIIDDEHENIITYIWDSDEQLTNCQDMFKGLSEILFINFTNFDLSQVTNMDDMFNGCNALTSIDFNSNVKINSLLTFTSMFLECYSLEYLDLSFMDTSSITDMSYLFADCHSLKYLDISNFNTTSVQTMINMFQDCHSLSSLNLNNFNTSSVENMNSMFYNCFSLEFLYLDNFDTKLVINTASMFENCEKLISLDLQNFDTSSVKVMNSMFYNCVSLLFLRINFKVGEYLEIDSYFFPYTNTIKMCINDEFINFLDRNDYFQYKDYELNCSDTCFQENKKIIIDKKECVFNCFDDEKYILEYNNICYQSCPEGSHPVSDIKCISDIEMNSQPSDSDFNTNNINIFNDSICIIYDNYTFDLNEIITNIKKDSLICKLNLFKLFSKDNKDIFIKDNNRIYQITSSYNQYNNSYNNVSTIILGQCEERLRKKNNIDDNDLLLIFKMEIKEEGYLIPVVEYEVYDLKKEKKLDLRDCEDLKIDIFMPVSIDENNLFLYNISSEYYNDLCFPYTTENKTDIIIDDRRKEYIKNNLSLCERNCELNNYNPNEKKVKCKCPVKIIFPSIDEIIINPDSYLTNFADFRKISNLEVIKCYRLFFTEKGFKKNIGNYILIFLIIFEIILAIIFKAKDYKIIIDKIYKIINLKKEEKNNEIVKDNNKIIIHNGNNENKGRRIKKKKKKKLSDTQILKIENCPNRPKKTGINILFRKSNFTKKDEDTIDKNTNSKLDSKFLTKNMKNEQNPDTTFINILSPKNVKIIF
jgi:surface protein